MSNRIFLFVFVILNLSVSAQTKNEQYYLQNAPFKMPCWLKCLLFVHTNCAIIFFSADNGYEYKGAKDINFNNVRLILPDKVQSLTSVQ